MASIIIVGSGDGESEGQRFELDPSEPLVGIGSASANRILLTGDEVAPWHAAVVMEGDRFLVIDLKSPVGVWVEGELAAEAELEDGDVIRIGEHELRFEAGPPARSGEPRHTERPRAPGWIPWLGLLAGAGGAATVVVGGLAWSWRSQLDDVRALAEVKALEASLVTEQLKQARAAVDAARGEASELSALKETLDGMRKESERKEAEAKAAAEADQGKLEERLRAAEEENLRLRNEFEAYRKAYRISVREKAPGTVLGSLELSGGRSLSEVSIDSISEAYLVVRHAAGLATLDFRELPDDLREHYLFDPAKAAAERSGVAAARDMRQLEDAAAKRASTERSARLRMEYVERETARLEAENERLRNHVGTVRESNLSAPDEEKALLSIRRKLQVNQSTLESLGRERRLLDDLLRE